MIGLLNLVRRLRDPDAGCPWDRRQTEESLAPYLIEEAYEVVDAIEREAVGELSTELGDLLFVVILLSCVGQEKGQFDFYTIVDQLSTKLIGRHAHVFASTETVVASSSAPWQKWERAKLSDRQSLSQGLPKSLPALMAAQKLQRRAAAIGFDWSDYRGPQSKVVEEWTELQAAVADEDLDSIKEEFGDLLFSLVNLARHLEIDCEQTLRAANAKFENRFAFIENQLACEGKRPQDVSLDTLNRLWEQAKLAATSTSGVCDSGD